MKLEDEMQVVVRHADGKMLAGRIGNVGVMLFNQPEKRNAVNLEMWEGVCAVLDSFAADDAVRVVIYGGTGGKAFTAGNDISQFAERRNNAESNAEYARRTGLGQEKLAHFPKPSIACIQGYCLGGGLGTAMHADLRVASADAVFGVPATRMGLAYAFSSTERLVGLVGAARARLMIYTARKFNAQEAFDMGLVDVLAREDVVRESLDLATTIASNAPLSVLTSKFAIAQVQKPAAEQDHAKMADWTRRCMDSADYREGRTAFMEKRPPKFVGA